MIPVTYTTRPNAAGTATAWADVKISRDSIGVRILVHSDPLPGPAGGDSAPDGEIDLTPGQARMLGLKLIGAAAVCDYREELKGE